MSGPSGSSPPRASSRPVRPLGTARRAARSRTPTPSNPSGSNAPSPQPQSPRPAAPPAAPVSALTPWFPYPVDAAASSSRPHRQRGIRRAVSAGPSTPIPVSRPQQTAAALQAMQAATHSHASSSALPVQERELSDADKERLHFKSVLQAFDAYLPHSVRHTVKRHTRPMSAYCPPAA